MTRVRVFRNRREAEAWRAESKMSQDASEARKMIEQAAQAVIKRDMAGKSGHWIESRGVAGDGREKWAIFSPSGVLLGMVWGKERAEAAVAKLVATGRMSVA
jgi:hypothetical protein